MKRIGGLLLALAASVAMFAQNAADPVVMKINGQDVLRSEFERAYNRNKATETSVKDYVDLYINYRLKIDEAVKNHIDTAASFKKEFASYRDELLMEYITDEQFEDSIIRSSYEGLKTQLKDSDILKVSHIFVAIPQQGGADAKKAAKARIDSIYKLLQNGADFAETAKACSQDRMTAAKGGELPDIGPGTVIQDFLDVCYTLKAGEMSAPFLTTAGYHIALMRARHKLEPYEVKRAEIRDILNRQGLQQYVFAHAVDELVRNSGGKTREEVLDSVQKAHETENPDLKFTVKDYKEGLLAFEITKREVWDKAEKDETGLENFFNKNKKNYKWDSPKFKGFVFHTTEEALVPQVRDVLKKHAKGDWNAEVKNQFEKDGKPQAMVSQGLWKEGENRFVDKYAFKKDDVKVKENKKFPYAGVEGKILKKGPEEMADVRAQVTSDYQDIKEKEWIKKLRTAGQIEVFNDVVDTVNGH